MRLRKHEIEIISKDVTDSLLEHGCVETEDAEKMCMEIGRVIHDELRLEDVLNEEVKDILEAHSAEISKTNVEYRSMFNMVKKKLVKERGIIL